MSGSARDTLGTVVLVFDNRQRAAVAAAFKQARIRPSTRGSIFAPALTRGSRKAEAPLLHHIRFDVSRGGGVSPTRPVSCPAAVHVATVPEDSSTRDCGAYGVGGALTPGRDGDQDRMVRPCHKRGARQRRAPRQPGHRSAACLGPAHRPSEVPREPGLRTKTVGCGE